MAKKPQWNERPHLQGGTNISNPAVANFVSRITAAWRQAVASIIETGGLLIRGKAARKPMNTCVAAALRQCGLLLRMAAISASDISSGCLRVCSPHSIYSPANLASLSGMLHLGATLPAPL